MTAHISVVPACSVSGLINETKTKERLISDAVYRNTVLKTMWNGLHWNKDFFFILLGSKISIHKYLMYISGPVLFVSDFFMPVNLE